MKSFRKMLWTGAAFAPSPLWACATCSGHSDSPLAYGMNAGIFTLLGVIGVVLACLVLFFVHVIRGEKAHPDDSVPPATPKNPGDV